MQILRRTQQRTMQRIPYPFLFSWVAVLALYVVDATPSPSSSLATAPSSSLEEMLALARDPSIRDWMTGCREHLHTIPEVSFQEHDTSAFIRSKLDELGVPYVYPVAKTGITAVIGRPSGGEKEGEVVPTIALRADMDALPIEEPEDMGGPTRSQRPGKMHACGHDAHVSMLLGAAKLLLKFQQQEQQGSEGDNSKGRGVGEEVGGLLSRGRVMLVFQPAEEGVGGAKVMIDEGAIKGVHAVHGVHVWPGLPSGTIATKPGTIMAASDRFVFKVEGRGGHGAMPHLAADPVVAASAIVLALQTLVSRETSPTDSVVISVTRINTGPGASNVIPDSVDIRGTLRALTVHAFERLHRRIEAVVRGTAEVHGCKVGEVEWSAFPYPPTVNDPGMAGLVEDLASEGINFQKKNKKNDGGGGVTGQGDYSWTLLDAPSMAAEDFSYFCQAVPSVFTFLGIGDPALGTDVSLHNPRFKMDDRQLPLGAALHASVALRFLERQQLMQQGAAATEAHSGAHEEL